MPSISSVAWVTAPISSDRGRGYVNVLSERRLRHSGSGPSRGAKRRAPARRRTIGGSRRSAASSLASRARASGFAAACPGACLVLLLRGMTDTARPRSRCRSSRFSGPGTGCPIATTSRRGTRRLRRRSASRSPTTCLRCGSIPASGGAELIGPEALAQDELPVPLPRPRVADEGDRHARGHRRAGRLPVGGVPADPVRPQRRGPAAGGRAGRRPL